MKPAEIGKMLRELREGKEVHCPECQVGIIKTPYNPGTSTYFECTKCNFKINMEPVNKKIEPIKILAER